MNYKIVGGDGKEYGPASAETLQKWIADGRANAQTQVQAEGETGWKTVAEVPELAAHLPGVASAPTAEPAASGSTLRTTPGYTGPTYHTPTTSAPPTFGGSAPLPPGTVSNYLVWAILTTVCCCVPLGIPAIVYAAQVNSKLALGDLAGAQESSRKAKMWCIIAAAAGGVGMLIYFAIMAMGVATGSIQH